MDKLSSSLVRLCHAGSVCPPVSRASMHPRMLAPVTEIATSSPGDVHQPDGAATWATHGQAGLQSDNSVGARGISWMVACEIGLGRPCRPPAVQPGVGPGWSLSTGMPGTHRALPLATLSITRRTTSGILGPRSTRSPRKIILRPCGCDHAPTGPVGHMPRETYVPWTHAKRGPMVFISAAATPSRHHAHACRCRCMGMFPRCNSRDHGIAIYPKRFVAPPCCLSSGLATSIEPLPMEREVPALPVRIVALS